MTSPLTVKMDFSDLADYADKFEITLIPRMIEQVAVAIFGEISREAPVDTGRLAGSVQFPERTAHTEFAIEINAEYWKHVQFGTGIHGPNKKPYPIFPKRKKALAFKVEGRLVVVKYVKAHPGRRPDPFVDRAITTVEASLDQIAESVLREAT